MTERAARTAARRTGKSNASPYTDLYDASALPRSQRPSDASHTINLFLSAQTALETVSDALHQLKGLELAKAWHYQGMEISPDQDAALQDLQEAQSTVRSLSAWMGRQAALFKARHAHSDDQDGLGSLPSRKRPHAGLSPNSAHVLARTLRSAIGDHGLRLPTPATNDILNLFR